MNATKNLATLLYNNSEPEEILNLITREAARLLKSDVAIINLVTDTHVIAKSAVGLQQGSSFKRQGTFCSVAAEQDEPLCISDAVANEQFKDTELVACAPFLRAYLGKSLHAPDGSPIGTLCVLDTEPREYTAHEQSIITTLAHHAEEQLHRILRFTLPNAELSAEVA